MAALLEGLCGVPLEEPTPRHSWPSGRERFLWEQNAVMCFPLGGASSPACYPSSSAVVAPRPILESIFRFSLQPALSYGQKWQPKLTKMSKWSLLGEYWSLVAFDPILLFVYIDLTWTATRLPQSLPLHTLVYPGILFHRFPSSICFLAPRKSSNFLFVNNTAVIFQSFCFVLLLFLKVSFCLKFHCLNSSRLGPEPLFFQSTPKISYTKNSSRSSSAQASTLVSRSMCPVA